MPKPPAAPVATLDVVLPAHNAAATLPTALQSVGAQTRPPDAILVVADRCSDQTAAIARAAGAVVLEADAGNPGAARNVGLRESSADLVAFLDADDLWRPSWLEAAKAAIVGVREAVMARGRFEEQLPSGEVVRKAAPLPSGTSAFDALLDGNPVATPAVVVRRGAALALGGFDEGLRYGEDWDLWLRLAETGPIADVPGCHVVVRRLEGSVTRSSSSLLAQRDQLLDVLDRAVARHPVAPERYRRARATVLKHSALRCLAHDHTASARVDLQAALELAPDDAEAWALSVASVFSPRARALAAAAKHAWRRRAAQEGR